MNSTTIQDVSERYGFKITDIFVNMGFAANCHFWTTKFEGVYITDYDIRSDSDLKKHDLSMLFFRKEGRVSAQLISNDLLQDQEMFSYVLESFNKEFII